MKGMRSSSISAGLLLLSMVALASPSEARCRAGLEIGGACWFLGESGQSCTDACAAAGFPYDEATRTYAGSDGTNEHCDMVLDALGATGNPAFAIDCSPDGLGCVKEDSNIGDRFRCTDPTEADAGGSGFRACACRAGGLPAPAMSPSSLALLMGVLFVLGASGLRRRRQAH